MNTEQKNKLKEEYVRLYIRANREMLIAFGVNYNPEQLILGAIEGWEQIQNNTQKKCKED